jgi:hypothetical protein
MRHLRQSDRQEGLQTGVGNPKGKGVMTHYRKWNLTWVGVHVMHGRNVTEKTCRRSLHLVTPMALLALCGHKALPCLISHRCTLPPIIHHPFWMTVPCPYQTRTELPSVGKLMLQALCIGGSSAPSHRWKVEGIGHGSYWESWGQQH